MNFAISLKRMTDPIRIISSIIDAIARGNALKG